MPTSTGTVIAASALVAVCDGVAVIDGSGLGDDTGVRRSASSSSGVSDSSTARSITLRSSRTLPGQSCFIIRSIVSCAIDAVSPLGVVAMQPKLLRVLDRLVRTDPADLLALEHAQQLGLHR